MSKESYKTQAYSPACFDNLRYLEDAQKELESRNLTREDLMPVRELFHKHHVQKQLGLTILHRHFNMASNERLVEYGKVTTPWILRSDEIFGGKIVPRVWALHKGELYPTEFGFNPFGETTYPDIIFSSEFFSEFKDLFSKLSLDDLFGLTVLDNGNPLDMPGVERTIGRVSLNIPFQEGETNNTVEAVWTFGCHESLDNSTVWPARICWVCKECKRK